MGHTLIRLAASSLLVFSAGWRVAHPLTASAQEVATECVLCVPPPVMCLDYHQEWDWTCQTQCHSVSTAEMCPIENAEYCGTSLAALYCS